ncbi:energy transducer TonB [Burkholderia territorii]|uniref:energy transducer TonB n=1 Tax=Burkholderia territorii TaxID=1503055 RepID=UPI00075B9784|nr:energy transducer TonB [Burkholderia territorii]KUY95417.1 energy transducer TonB [Burkholderia territorii]KUZ08980.1 energy transducer TonB [Burkholderia territorii]
MTGLAIEYGVPPARRHAARTAAAVAVPATRLPPAEPPARKDVRPAQPGGWRDAGAIALAVTALHAGIALLAARAPAEPPVQPPRPLPMTVELTRPPESLPQAVHPPPPVVPPKPLKQAPTPPKPRAAVAHQAATPAVVPPVARDASTAAPAQVAAAPAIPNPSPVSAAPAAPVRESAPIGDAAYLRNPAPDYPAFAQDQGWEGRVVLRVHVLANGTPDSVDVRTSSGRRVLDNAAVAAVKRWTFMPAKRGDEAVDGWVNVPIDFKLG